MELRTVLTSLLLITNLQSIICFKPTSGWTSNPGAPMAPESNCGASLKQTIIAQIFKGYEKQVRPPPGDSSNPTEVTIDAYLINVQEVDDGKGQWTIDFIIRQTWYDPRLEYSAMVKNCPKFQYIQLINDDGFGSIWRPDTFIRGEMSGEIHDLLQTNRFLRIYPDGLIYTSAYMTTTVPCKGLGAKPGQYICGLPIAPYGSQSFDIVLKWKEDGPIQTDEKPYTTNGYTLTKIETSAAIRTTASGSYSSVYGRFYFDKIVSCAKELEM